MKILRAGLSCVSTINHLSTLVPTKCHVHTECPGGVEPDSRGRDWDRPDTLAPPHTLSRTQFQMEGGGLVQKFTKLITTFSDFVTKKTFMVVELTQILVDSPCLECLMFL